MCYDMSSFHNTNEETAQRSGVKRSIRGTEWRKRSVRMEEEREGERERERGEMFFFLSSIVLSDVSSFF